MRRRAALLAFSLLSSCKDEAEPTTPEAGVVALRSIGAKDLGVYVSLPVGWAEEGVESQAPTKEGGPSVGLKEAKTVAQARRVSTQRPFLVAPKVVVTVEPTVRKNPEEVFQETLDDLKQLDSNPNVGVTRTALSSRFVGRDQVGDLEMAYFVRSGDAPPREVVHRSLIVLRRPPEGSRAIVTVTATYLADDAEEVSAEIQAIMSSLRLEGAMAVE